MDKISIPKGLPNVVSEDYSTAWHHMFATILQGWWGHIIFFLLIVIAVVSAIRNRNPQGAIVCIILAILVALGSSIVKYFTK